MYNGWKIIIGIIIFAALVTSPFLFSGGKVVAKPDPKIDTPEIQKLPENERKCVESKEFMKTEHMKLLNDWRDSVVREGNRIYIGAGGKNYDMSLQNTCMKCHSNKKKFCDECHNYAAVKPYCWDCHIEPKEKET
ncbi:MAG: sulfate reduction electron transfer complex DsrMKJOP subunit DsrJ [Nitrospirota bacterium]